MANMRVILQQNVKNIGRIADEVSVKAGYARNFLLPQSIAVLATEANRAIVEAKRAELEKQAAQALAEAEKRAEPLKALTLTIRVQAMAEGKLYGSIGVDEVAAALKDAGHEVAKHEVIMANGPIKTIGESVINVVLHADVVVPVNVVLEATE